MKRIRIRRLPGQQFMLGFNREPLGWSSTGPRPAVFWRVCIGLHYIDFRTGG